MRLLIALFAAALCLSAGDVSGKWSGTATVKNPDGETRDAPVVLVLTQSGAEVTGTAGESEENQTAIKDGKLENDELTFRVEVNQDSGETRVFTAKLRLAGDKLEGDVNRNDGMTAKVSLKKI
jgi:hypothetical protein